MWACWIQRQFQSLHWSPVIPSITLVPHQSALSSKPASRPVPELNARCALPIGVIGRGRRGSCFAGRAVGLLACSFGFRLRLTRRSLGLCFGTFGRRELLVLLFLHRDLARIFGVLSGFAGA